MVWIVLLGLLPGVLAATRFDELEWYSYVALVLIGLVVGFIGGFAGIGGAPFMVGLLRLFVKFCQHEAQGTVLAVMLPPMSLMAVLVMKDRAKVLWKICTPAFLGYASFSYGGATLAFLLSEGVLTHVFGGFLIVLGLRYGKNFFEMKCRQAKRQLDSAMGNNEEPTEQEMANMSNAEQGDESTEQPDAAQAAARESEKWLNPDGPTVAEGYPIPFNYYTSGAIGAVIGVVGGLFGVGAGVLMVPVFTDLCGVHKDDARTLSLLILLPPVSIGAIIVYAQENSIDWAMAGVLFALYFVANYFGAQKGRSASVNNFKMIMGMLLSVLGAFLIVIKEVKNPVGSTDC